ncbi:MAG: glycosyl hydrolase family 8 [Defluviitaleaceae bacterium]|nr:glycosyl hydrolase family 8 [Defluviitaleaceae bacterium]
MRQYPDLFTEAGIAKQDVQQKIKTTFETMFFDPTHRIYYESGLDMGYMLDTGNNDARSEGMSYGMMMAMQMDRQDIFDRLWLFSKTYMHQASGPFEGYFAWSVKTDGTKNSQGPAPDGEEYFALALFFASARWGDGKAPFDYSVQARDILHHCVHQHEIVDGGQPMWEPSNYLIKFIPQSPYSDPSYHLPHFYEIFAERANAADHEFWKKAAKASRDYIAISCHPITGMAPEYAEFDGAPRFMFNKKQQFYSDAYRVAMNIGLDAAWYGKTAALSAAVDRLQSWFYTNTNLGDYDSYMLDGTPVDLPAMHPTAIIATNAAGSLAANGPHRLDWVRDFWKTPLRVGHRRYYDNCLYLFCLLMLAGEYKIY